jgi:alkylation response protein AidB-like acyl-CoA dehydrogenase
MQGQDTTEMFFYDDRLPIENLHGGEEGRGFAQLMKPLPRERMSIAVGSLASIDAVFAETREYCFSRKAFGKPIGDFQNTRFVMAELQTETTIARTFLDECVRQLNTGELTVSDAAMAKWWCTELQKRVIDQCVQLHGGYGYMAEYPIARAYADARITTIYGGTTEIMKEIIGRSLGV